MINTGKTGEEIAAEYLLLEGYEILERNVHLGHFEIDLIVRKGRTLVFVEVKSTGGRYSAEDRVTKKKRRFVKEAAERYLASHRIPDELESVRLDVIIVRFSKGDFVLMHYVDAF